MNSIPFRKTCHLTKQCCLTDTVRAESRKNPTHGLRGGVMLPAWPAARTASTQGAEDQTPTSFPPPKRGHWAAPGILHWGPARAAVHSASHAGAHIFLSSPETRRPRSRHQLTGILASLCPHVASPVVGGRSREGGSSFDLITSQRPHLRTQPRRG